MIQGYVDQEIPVSVNFLPSRAGLTTVGYTLVSHAHDIIVDRRTLGVVELLLGGYPTGMYTATLRFDAPFSGFVVWDTGQDPLGEGANRLRRAMEEVMIGAFSDTAEILDAVGALYEENVMKIPDGPAPTKIRFVRKRRGAPDWSTPLSDKTVPVVNKPGNLRFGGPPPTP